MSDNGWNEWSRHILAELKRLNDSQESLRAEIQSVNTSLARINAFDHKDLVDRVNILTADHGALRTTVTQPDGLLARDKDFEDRLRKLEQRMDTNTGKSSIILLIASPILAAIVSLLFAFLR
jgi:hypothetical protein